MSRFEVTVVVLPIVVAAIAFVTSSNNREIPVVSKRGPNEIIWPANCFLADVMKCSEAVFFRSVWPTRNARTRMRERQR